MFDTCCLCTLQEGEDSAAAKDGRFLSLVMDGMQQSHSELPWFGNNYNTTKKLKQHLQGVTTHGVSSDIFITFNNFKGGANLAIHTFLVALWNVYQREGRLPQHVYVEIDGGGENANQVDTNNNINRDY